MIDIGTNKETASKEKTDCMDLRTLPTSSGTDIIMNILGSRGDLGEIRDRRNEINRSSVATARKGSGASDKERRFIIESDREQFEIKIPDIDQFFGKTKAKTASRKLFTLILSEASKTNLQKGKITSKYVTFPLQYLVDLGIYTAKQNARRGFLNNMAPLLTMLVRGDKLKNGKLTGNGVIASMFTAASIDNGVCTIVLNEELNWNALIQFYTYLPEYYFKLSGKADALLYSIFYIARMHGKELKEKGYFKIKFRTLQYRLNLPDEEKIDHPNRDIREIIENAIEEVEEAHREAYGNDFLQITPKGYSETDNISQFLDNGYLEVRLKGDFITPFIKAEQNRKTKVTQARKRKEKIIDDAKVKTLAATMKEEQEKASKKESSR